MVTVSVAFGTLMLVARRLDARMHRAPLSGCQAIIAMATDWDKEGLWQPWIHKAASILGRAARLHSLSCLFMPSPRLVLRSEESIMLIVNLVMSFADIAALFDGPPPPNPLSYFIGILIRFVGLCFPFWLCRWLFIVGGASTRCGTAARAGGWVLSTLLFAALCADWLWTIVSLHSYELRVGPVLVRALAFAAEHWFIWEPLIVLVVSTSMQFCTCCKRCCVCCGKPPSSPESPPGGSELVVVAQPIGTTV